MEAAGGDTGKFNCRHSQTGFVSAVKGKRNGGETSEIRVRCDCPPQTLLATLAHSLVEASCSGVAGRGLDNAELEIESAEEPYRPVLLAQIGECRHQIRSARNVAHGGVAASLQLISGRIFLRGDILLVSGGTAFYSENSHLWMAPQNTSTSPAGQSSQSLPAAPTISGAMAQRSDLFACVADDLDGACLFYDAERSLLQLGSQQSILQRPLLHLGGRQFRLDLLARQLSNLDRIRPASNKDLPSAEAASAAASALLKSSAQRQSTGSLNLDVATNSQSGGDSLAPLRTLLLLGGRCLLHNDTIVVLSGLLHFVGSWYRVQTACSGSGFQQSIPRISGSSMLKRQRKKPSTVRRHNGEEAEAARNVAEAASGSSATGGDRPLLLNNVWLYTQGGTVFIGGSALLTEAQLAMSADFKPVPLDQQERLLASLPSSTRRQVPCRLFLQSGRFSLGPGSCSLRAVAGVAWLRGRKAPLGDADSAADQLLVRDAVVFLTQWPSGGSGDTGSAHWIEGRDLLYKDGLLYLDDLTPVLKGGRICLGQQEMQLEWLSGWSDESKVNGSQDSDFSAEEQQQQISQTGSSEGLVGVSVTDSSTDLGESDLITDCICLLESGGRCLHILRGRMRLTASEAGRSSVETVLVDRGVAYFVAESGRPTRMTAGFPPPRIVGWPLMPRPSESGRQWAGWVDRQLDTATFEKARLTLNRGTLCLNGEVPLMRGCQLLLNGQVYDIRQPSMPLVQLERSRESESLQRLQQLQAEPIDQAELRETENRQDYTEVNAGLGKGFPDKAAQQQQQHRQQQQQQQQEQQQHQQQQQQHQQQQQQHQQQHGFIGGYSVVANRQTDALIFNLKARFPDGLRFLFDAA
uniref:BTB domain-containing protein n=1 Tax=Macrostomum lignano TaxID=282301 RepID=A0A1I8HPN9_9PLAT